MKITCHSCGAKYTVSDTRVQGRKVKIRCKNCSTTIVVDGTQGIPAVHSAVASSPPEAAAVEAPAPVAPAPAQLSAGQPVGFRTGTLTGGLQAAAPAAVPAAPYQMQVSSGPAPEWSVSISDDDQRDMSLAEIVDGYRTGTLTNDVYVWKEGMDDWVPILDAPEIRARLGSQRPSAQPGALAARLAGSRAQDTADLFGAAAHGEAATPGETAYDQRPTGARNENSVLFSLDTLKAGVGDASLPKRAPVGTEDPFNMSTQAVANVGGGTLFSSSANQALLTAPAPPEPPKPKPVPAGPASQSAQAQIQKLKRMMLIGAAAFALLLAGGIVLALSFGGSEEKKVAQLDADQIKAEKDKAKSKADKGDEDKDKAKSDEESDKKDEKGSDEEKAEKGEDGDKKDEQNGDKSKSSSKQVSKNVASSGVAKSPTQAATPAAKPESESKPAPKKAPEKPPTTVKVKKNPSDGLDSINMAAVKAALSQAAAAAASCKKPNGPTGKGKATVTFATSGRVTSANVIGGTFGGNSVGGCVARVFRSAKVPPFSGSPVTVAKSFYIPK